MLKYDSNAIRRILPVSRVLADRGIALQGGRCPCPVCGSKNRHAFSVRKGDLQWKCFVCHKGGTVIDLVSALDGIPIGAAIGVCASLAGLTSLSPEAYRSARKASDARRALARESADIERARWLGRVTRAERLRATIADVASHGCTPLTWAVLGALYASLGEVEAWLETREYAPGTWAPV